MQLVAPGQLVAVWPESVRRRAWPDVACVPLVDAPPTTVVVACPERTTSRAVAAVIGASAEGGCAHRGRMADVFAYVEAEGAELQVAAPRCRSGAPRRRGPAAALW
ncbi:hypothetical protein JW613_13110 [Streptomyces smyrnaeus]|uniref:Uncharacterized protein n=2 Tax=Streptomyces smyrnaeus TaxID=1387713 RepID=A0ABS3XUZ6_9ACTN|nr:hypothetical protein [Streptomyces smyrnaeus]